MIRAVLLHDTNIYSIYIYNFIHITYKFSLWNIHIHYSRWKDIYIYIYNNLQQNIIYIYISYIFCLYIYIYVFTIVSIIAVKVRILYIYTYIYVPTYIYMYIQSIQEVSHVRWFCHILFALCHSDSSIRKDANHPNALLEAADVYVSHWFKHSKRCNFGICIYKMYIYIYAYIYIYIQILYIIYIYIYIYIYI